MSAPVEVNLQSDIGVSMAVVKAIIGHYTKGNINVVSIDVTKGMTMYMRIKIPGTELNELRPLLHCHNLLCGSEGTGADASIEALELAGFAVNDSLTMKIKSSPQVVLDESNKA